MKILVTGGGGFLGSILIEKLKHDHHIICLDHGRNYRLLDKYFGKKVTLVKGDASNKKLLKSQIKDTDIIIHLAGVAGERRCLKNPLKSNISNIYSTYAIADIAKDYNIKKIILSSSYWVYSTYIKRKMPLTEESELNTDSIYGSQKVLSEMIIKDSKVPYIIFRISNLYGYGTGVGSQWEGTVTKFIRSAFSGQPLTVYGDGKQKTDLIYVDDVAEAIKRILSLKVQNEVFNIGSGQPVSILDIANIIKKNFKQNYKTNVNFRKVKAPPGKIWPNKWMSVKKVRRLIIDYPFLGLEEGIYRSIKDFAPHF